MILKISAVIMSFICVFINLFGSVACSKDNQFQDISFYEEISDLFSVEREGFSCERDGLTIKGTVFLPKGKTDCPIAVISHGFMANQMFSQIHAQNLAKMGYAAFCFDFCGGTLVGSSDGDSTDMSVLTEVEDLKAVIEFAKSQSYTDENELILLGCSQGGFVSAIVAAEMKEEVDRTIKVDKGAGEDPQELIQRIFAGAENAEKAAAEASTEAENAANSAQEAKSYSEEIGGHIEHIEEIEKSLDAASKYLGARATVFELSKVYQPADVVMMPDGSVYRCIEISTGEYPQLSYKWVAVTVATAETFERDYNNDIMPVADPKPSTMWGIDENKDIYIKEVM